MSRLCHVCLRPIFQYNEYWYIQYIDKNYTKYRINKKRISMTVLELHGSKICCISDTEHMSIPWKMVRFEFYLSRSRNSLEFVPKSEKSRQNKKFCRKPGMLRNAKFQYYIETIFSTFCTPVNLEGRWCLLFGAKIVCTITCRVTFLTWTKPGILWLKQTALNTMLNENPLKKIKKNIGQRLMYPIFKKLYLTTLVF